MIVTTITVVTKTITITILRKVHTLMIIARGKRKVTMTIKKEDGNFIGHKTSLKEGLKAPDFEGKDQNDNPVKLSDFHGKNLILYFYPKDDTPACTATACNL